MAIIHPSHVNRLAIVFSLLLAFPTVISAQSPKEREAAFAKWVKVLPQKKVNQYESRLEELNLASKDSIPLFISRITADDSNVRLAAVIGLYLVAHLDPDAAIPSLALAAKDSDLMVRNWAVRGLGKIGPPAATEIAVLIDVLEKDEWNSFCAIEAIEKLGVKDQSVLDALTGVLHHKGGLTRSAAAHALGNIGPESRNAATTLRTLFRDDDPSVRLNAAYAIWKIEQSPDAIMELTSLLESEDSTICYRTIKAMGEIGPPAKAAIPAIKKVQKREEVFTVYISIWAIGQIQQPGKPTPSE